MIRQQNVAGVHTHTHTHTHTQVILKNNINSIIYNRIGVLCVFKMQNNIAIFLEFINL